MPKLLRAPPKDLGEERQVRKLAGSYLAVAAEGLGGLGTGPAAGAHRG